jgi:hypothetical protein
VFVRRVGAAAGTEAAPLSDALLRAAFLPHGVVERVMVPVRAGSREPFAFVHFKERDAALAVPYPPSLPRDSV